MMVNTENLASITEANDEDLLNLSKRIIEKNRKVYEELDYGKTRKNKNIRRYRNIMKNEFKLKTIDQKFNT